MRKLVLKIYDGEKWTETEWVEVSAQSPEPPIKEVRPIAQSDIFENIGTGDGCILYNNSIYILSRNNNRMLKVNARDYMDTLGREQMGTNGGNALCESDGWLWKGDGNGRWLYRIDPLNLQVVEKYSLFKDYDNNMIDSLCADKDFIYAGGWFTNGGLALARLNKETWQVENSLLPIGEKQSYIHSMVGKGEYLYCNVVGPTSYVLRVRKNDLQVDNWRAMTLYCHDDMLEEDLFIYLANDKLRCFDKFLVLETSLEIPTLGGYIDGMAMLPDGTKLLADAMPQVGGRTRVHVVKPNFTYSHAVEIVGLSNPDGYRFNEILVDGDYVHLLSGQIGSYGVSFAKFELNNFLERGEG